MDEFVGEHGPETFIPTRPGSIVPIPPPATEGTWVGKDGDMAVSITYERTATGARITSMWLFGDNIATDALRAVHPARLLARALAAEDGEPEALPSLVGRPGRNPDDAFFLAVAKAYRSYACASHRPVVEMARREGVHVSTLRRWLQEARRRGHLAPSKMGRAL